MNRFVFYHKDTGALHQKELFLAVVDLKTALKNNTPEDHVALRHETAFHTTHRFDLAKGELVEDRKPAPSLAHEWSEERKDWVLSKAARDAHAELRTEVSRLMETQRRATSRYLLGLVKIEELHQIETDLTAAQERLSHG